MTEPDTDLAEVLGQFTNLIMNERVRSYNEGLDAGRAEKPPMRPEDEALLRECRALFVNIKPYCPIGIGILTDITNIVAVIDGVAVSRPHLSTPEKSDG